MMPGKRLCPLFFKCVPFGTEGLELSFQYHRYLGYTTFHTEKKPFPPAAPMPNYNWPLPTILVAGSPPPSSDAVAVLQRDGYLVLESRDEGEAMEIVRMHSRPIHVMLIDESALGHTLASRLTMYRPQMRVLFIDWNAQENVTRRVREILRETYSADSPSEFRRTPGSDRVDRGPSVRRRSA